MKNARIDNSRTTDRDIILRNVFLPLWLLIFWPSWLWLLLIPLNYLYDRIILRWSLGDMPEKGRFCRGHNWKICLAGFASDFVGAAILLAVFMGTSAVSEGSAVAELLEKVAYGVGFNPFSHPLAFLVVALSVAASAGLIYLLDRSILKKAGLAAEQARKSAWQLAVFTAPYLYFFPSAVLYNGGI